MKTLLEFSKSYKYVYERYIFLFRHGYSCKWTANVMLTLSKSKTKINKIKYADAFIPGEVTFLEIPTIHQYIFGPLNAT